MIRTKFGYMTAMEANLIGQIDKELAIKKRKEQKIEKRTNRKETFKKVKSAYK